MTFLKNFGAFWYDFIVGDDWLIAIGTVAILLLTAFLARNSYEETVWPLLPVGAALILGVSSYRAARK